MMQPDIVPTVVIPGAWGGWPDQAKTGVDGRPADSPVLDLLQRPPSWPSCSVHGFGSVCQLSP
jgi:hypothetical protein